MVSSMTSDTPQAQHRMRVDAERIGSPDRWPCYPMLCLKTQPWVQPMRFADVFVGAPLTIIGKHGQPTGETFESVEEMVKVWSVD